MWNDLGREWLAAVDRPYTTDELVSVGERIWTLIRLFNAREGFDRRSDRLPETMLQPVSSGTAAGLSMASDEFEVALDAYYHARGWGPNGLPIRETVDRLDLLDALDEETPLDESW